MKDSGAWFDIKSNALSKGVCDVSVEKIDVMTNGKNYDKAIGGTF